MNSFVEFMQQNKEWVVPIVIAILTTLITGIFNLVRKSKGENIHKQQMGNIKNSKVFNINGDVNKSSSNGSRT